MEVEYRQLNSKNFTNHSLDDFIRHQQVSECWRNVEGAWNLVPISFEENWSLEQCREIAADVAVHMENDQTAFGAFEGDKLVGFITLSHNVFGNTAKYLELVCFQVSEPYRGKGIGKILFQQACEEAQRLGAEKLYISGHSSKESQAAYKALGCVHAKEINQKLAEEEPFDVQLEYALREDENEHNVSVRLLLAAGALMLLSGCIFGFTQQWIYAALVWIGAFGCLIAALNFKNRKGE